MTSKKKRKSEDIRAKRRKKKTRFFFLSIIVLAGVGFLAVLFFTLSEYIDLTPGKEGSKKKERQQAVLYFSDANERFLVAEKRLIPKRSGPELQAEEVVKALIEGPKTDLVRTLPEEARLEGVSLENGTASVRFDSNLTAHHPGGSASEAATVYSLTNSLTSNIPEIKRVRILVDGKAETLKGHIDIRTPFVYNREIVAQNPVD
jgi:spore germination protein GerM